MTSDDPLRDELLDLHARTEQHMRGHEDTCFMRALNRYEAAEQEVKVLKRRIAELETSLSERTLQHAVQHENAIRLLFAVESAIQQAQDEGHDRYRGTDTPKPFFETLWYAVNERQSNGQ